MLLIATSLDSTLVIVTRSRRSNVENPTIASTSVVLLMVVVLPRKVVMEATPGARLHLWQAVSNDFGEWPGQQYVV